MTMASFGKLFAGDDFPASQSFSLLTLGLKSFRVEHYSTLQYTCIVTPSNLEGVTILVAGCSWKFQEHPATQIYMIFVDV